MTLRSRAAEAARFSLSIAPLLPLALFAGCASVTRVHEPVVTETPPVMTSPAARGGAPTPAPERQDALNQALEQTLLAREQGRLGLMDEAQASWERALAVLRPLAAHDAEIAERLRRIEAERDGALRAAELRANNDLDADATEAPAQEILDNPEPALDPSQLAQVGQAAQDVTADYPIALNDRVYAWLEQWSQGGLRRIMAASLERSGAYVERFRQIFAEEGLPQDLIYLAHVESGFQTAAYSRAAARGIFQFIAETGRRYGLASNWWLDERADPEKSCRASAAYLRDLFAEFQDWNLALAAYNCGEGRVRDVIARTGVRDFWSPANQRLFPVDTRNYVPAIQAATLIAKNPAKFGFGDLQPRTPVAYELVTVPQPMSLSVLAGVAKIDVDTLRQMNPALRRHATPPGVRDYVLKVPVGSAEGFAERLAAIPADRRIVQQEHVVRRGETLTTIARRYGASTRAIAEANQLGRRPRLTAGMVLVIPDGPDRGAPDPVVAVASSKASGGTYVVRRGDFMSGIAQRFGVSVKQLQAWNKMGSSVAIVAGQRLRVTPPVDRPAPQQARASKSTPAAGPKAPVAAAPKSPAAPKTAAAKNPRSHVVKRGETLWQISQLYGVSAGDIAAANKLGRKPTLHVGQRLTIPVA